MKLSTSLTIAALFASCAVGASFAQTPPPPPIPPEQMAPQHMPPPNGGPNGGYEGWRAAHWRMMNGEGWRHHPNISPADKAAFLDAYVAGLRAGLELTPAQEKLWPPVETAIREHVKTRQDMHEKMRTQSPPADMIEAVRRKAEMKITCGESLKKLADSAAPLFAALSSEQKARLPFLMKGGLLRHIMHMGGQPGEHMRNEASPPKGSREEQDGDED